MKVLVTGAGGFVGVAYIVGSVLRLPGGTLRSAGILFAVYYGSIQPLMGVIPGLKAFVAAVLVVTYLDSDSLSREDGWRFAAFAVIAYIVSRHRRVAINELLIRPTEQVR